MSVYPKLPQQQSMSLVNQGFDEKTIAALHVLEIKVEFNEGTVVFIQVAVKWFKIYNIKEKYDTGGDTNCLSDELRTPPILYCSSFKKLEKHSITEVISTCESSGTRRLKKSTTQTIDTFKIATEFNIKAARCLLENYV